jgi:Cof subfamily protein (haloacid dehalogenase superfamily)/HAD superfamily hydrolase (TIGR01509 family)
MTIKVVIADVDGTLLTRDKVLTEGTRDAVARLRDAGVQFIITSGRPPRGMAKLVEPLGITDPIAAFNGGVYVQPDTTTVLAQRIIAPSAASEIVDYLLKRGLDVWVYRGTDWYLRNPEAFRVARERSNVGFDPIVVDDLEWTLDEAIKIVGVGEDPSLVARCEVELRAHLGTRASADRSTPFYVDVTHPEANKGMVVRQTARMLGISLGQIATVGDMPNDIHMLSIAGRGIAMGNANAEVKRAARHVTASNEEEGFARAIDTFILGQPPITQTALGLPPRTRACLFELDGVLAQTSKLDAEAWRQVFDDYLRERSEGAVGGAAEEPFVAFDTLHDYATHLDNKPHWSGVESFCASRGIELLDPTIRALIDRHDEILRELLHKERAETYEGSVRYLRAARDAGLRTAAVSFRKHGTDTLRAAGVADLFDASIDGVVAFEQQFGDLPAPDVYLAAAAEVGVAPELAAIFEDAVAGVDAARAGHFGYIVGVDRLGQGAELQKHGADVVVQDLGALMARG